MHAWFSTGNDAPAHAREALQPLRGLVGSECFEVVELVVSELMTNSVRHAGAVPGEPIELSVHCTDHTVRVVVSDVGAGFDPARRHVEGEPGGWGLRLVAEVSDRWWVECGERTRVVAEVPLPATRSCSGEPEDLRYA